MSSEGSLDVAKARSLFPSLSAQPPFVFADNAGGSQCSKPAIDRIVDYLLNSNVQPSSDYSVSRTSMDRVALGKEAARVLFDAAGVGEIALGASATLLMENLARAIEADLGDQDEIIVTGEHEGVGF
jgi:selenocysteine lyase/cysteine desulfurase